VLRRSGRARLSRRHISDDGLPAIVDVDVLDPNVLLAAMPKAASPGLVDEQDGWQRRNKFGMSAP
jgi:hypothetical protein